jgi:diacylglycerol kinase family enzyme
VDPIPVIVNSDSRSGSNSSQIEELCGALDRLGVSATVLPVRPRAIHDAVREAARSHPVVAVAGGDGTLSTAAGALASSEAALAPIPLGTRNHFARRIGIDGVDAAARSIAAGRVTRVSLGTVCGLTFINHASAGLYPRMLRVRRRVKRFTGKSLGNFVAGAYVVMRRSPTLLGIDSDGVQHVRSVAGIWVGIGRGSFRLPVDNAPGEGPVLEVLVAPDAARAATLVRGLRVIRELYHQRDLESTGLDVLHVTSFTVEAPHGVDLSLDGEVLRVAPPLDFAVLPDALRVVSLL